MKNKNTENNKRLDVFLTENFNLGRQKAAELIKLKAVNVNGKTVLKAGHKLKADDEVEILYNPFKFVSRGGLKLEKAIKVFNLNINGLVCADIGASTGGFCDCMLQNNAKKVYAIDVGTNQLHKSLIEYSKVVNIEKTNFRYFDVNSIEKVDFAATDVSFISLKYILNNMHLILKQNAAAVVLVKPQFEAGKENIGKNGTVKKREVHKQVLKNAITFAEKALFTVKGLCFSPIKGPNGNIEYLILLKNSENEGFNFNINVSKTVEEAFENLKD